MAVLVSAIVLDNRLAHYESVGRRGQPIIFLHSWLGSWRYWLPTMEHLSERYKAYAIDFWGFGESDRRGDEFSVSLYVRMLLDFMKAMGMQRANLVGHGMGGMVAIKSAIEQPALFPKVMIVNAPIHGAQILSVVKTNPFERLLGRSNPNNVWSKLVQRIEVGDRQIHREIIEDTESLPEKLVDRVIQSVAKTDLREELAKLQLPLLAVYGERDTIVGPEHVHQLRDDHAFLQQVIRLPKSNHFPFLDQPNVFNRMLQDFLASQGDAVQIKTEWRRRVSQLEYI